MWFKSKWWILIAWILVIVNVTGIWIAARGAETWHATIHGLLAAIFVLGAERLASRRRVQLSANTERVKQLENSIDTIAAELGRVGEEQRHLAEVLTRKKDEERR